MQVVFMLLQTNGNDRLTYCFQKTPKKWFWVFISASLEKALCIKRTHVKKNSQARSYKFHATLCFVLRNVDVGIKLNCFFLCQRLCRLALDTFL
jgi:hypothetical protein